MGTRLISYLAWCLVAIAAAATVAAAAAAAAVAAAAVTAAAVAAAAAAAAASSAAAAAVTTWGTLGCTVNTNGPTVKVTSIEFFASLCGSRFIREGYETESAGAARIALHDDLGVGYFAALFKVGFKGLIMGGPREASNKQLRTHVFFPIVFKRPCKIRVPPG
jgi:hypothetical protein